MHTLLQSTQAARLGVGSATCTPSQHGILPASEQQLPRVDLGAHALGELCSSVRFDCHQINPLQRTVQFDPAEHASLGPCPLGQACDNTGTEDK